MTTPLQTTDATSTITYPVTSTSTAPPPAQYFTAEQLEAARQQEKDKLYGRLEDQNKAIDQFKSQLEELQTDKQARDKAIADAAKEAEEARKREEDSKLSSEEFIRAKEAELSARQKEFSEQMELKIATMEKEQEFLRLQSFIQRRVAEEIAADNIIPDLVEYIGGNTEDEVEVSITKAKEKTANIVQGAATLSAPQMPRGVSPTGGPSGPLDNITGPRQYSKEDIAKMDMNEYAKFRQNQGIAGAGNNRGMFQ